MTQKQKQLLLVDLCARLPYQPICEFTDTEDDFCTTTAALGYSLRDFIAGKVLIKPYLRPMSSMTEEEKEEWHNTFDSVQDYVPEADDYDDNWHEEPGIESYDYLISHHFDYRGLIPKGLALEATEDMYKEK